MAFPFALLAIFAGSLVAGDSVLIAVVLIASVGFLACALARTEQTALALIVVIPFTVYAGSFRGFSLLTAIPMFVLVSVLLIMRYGDQLNAVVNSLPSRTFLVLIGIAVLTSFASTDPARAGSRTAYLIMFALFAIALGCALSAGAITTQNLVTAVVISGAISGAAVSIQFILQFTVGRGSVLDWLRDVLTTFGGENAGSRNWEIDDPDVLRGVFPFMTPPSAGQFLMLALVAAVWLRRQPFPRPPHGDALEIAALLMIIAGLLMTFSRQSWVGALIGVAALAVGRRPGVLVAVALGTAALYFAPLPNGDGTFGNYLAAASDTSTRSTSGRLDLWEEAIDQIPEQAVIGVGPGLFDTLVLDADSGAVYAHNFILDAAVELGAAGAITLLCLFGFAFALALRRRLDLPFALLAAYFAAGMFDDVFYFPRNGLLLAVAFALLVPVARQAAESEPARSPSYPS